jgi:DNA-binding transcriptional ArsR family regulator
LGIDALVPICNRLNTPIKAERRNALLGAAQRPERQSHFIARGAEAHHHMQNQAKKINAEAAALKRALCHPRRLEILSFLIRRHGGAEAGSLAEELDLTLAQATYHLKVLEGAALVADADSLGQGTTNRYVVVAPSG